MKNKLITFVLAALTAIILSAINKISLTYGFDLSTFIICIAIGFNLKKIRIFLFKESPEISEAEAQKEYQIGLSLLLAIKEAVNWDKNLTPIEKLQHTTSELKNKAVENIYFKYKQKTNK
jgi:hypothetical protein